MSWGIARRKIGLKFCQLPAKRRRKEPAVSAKKWGKTDEQVEALQYLVWLGIDFEANLKEMYSVVHRSMACKFPSEFGPEQVTEPSIWVKDMSSEEYDLFKKTFLHNYPFIVLARHLAFILH